MILKLELNCSVYYCRSFKFYTIFMMFFHIFSKIYFCITGILMVSNVLYMPPKYMHTVLLILILTSKFVTASRNIPVDHFIFFR